MELSQVQLTDVPLRCNSFVQVTRIHVHLSQNSIILYWSKDDDALQLGR